MSTANHQSELIKCPANWALILRNGSLTNQICKAKSFCFTKEYNIFNNSRVHLNLLALSENVLNEGS